MRFLFGLIILLVYSNPVFAFCDDWRGSDTLLLTSALIVTEIDREQTQWFLAQVITQQKTVETSTAETVTRRGHTRTVTKTSESQSKFSISPYYEQWNFLIPGHPTATTVDTTIVLGTVSSIVASCLLPHPWRTVFFVTWITVETSATYHNVHDVGTPTPLLGMKLSF